MCDERERLIGYVYDEVDAEERQRVRRHLDGCDVCREEIGGLRRVREDLLAWDVPDHGSVWKPFAPARVTPWWREVPGWALAAAATLVFAVGAAGGVATQALMASPAQAAAVAPVEAIPASLSDAQLAILEERLRQFVRSSMAADTVSSTTARQVQMPANLLTASDMDDFERRLTGVVEGMYMSFSNDLDRTLDRVEKVEGAQRSLASFGTLGPGNN